MGTTQIIPTPTGFEIRQMGFKKATAKTEAEAQAKAAKLEGQEQYIQDRKRIWR